VWNKTQIAAFERALAAMGKACPACDALAEIAKHSPEFADRVKELQTRAENTKTLATVALQAKSLP
jgi:hypothetical protein